MLKGVKCVVVNEDADGSLCRQQVGGVIERMLQVFKAITSGSGSGLGGRHGR